MKHFQKWYQKFLLPVVIIVAIVAAAWYFGDRIPGTGFPPYTYPASGATK